MEVFTENASIVIVMGMHRSGTSAVANFIASLGFDAGNNLMPADEDNQKGYWEDNDIYQLNNDILSFLFLNWDQIEEFDYRRINILTGLLYEMFAPKAIEIINNKLEKSPHIVIKDPRFSILLPFWNDVLNQFDIKKHFILTLRNPESVSNSVFKRNKIPQQESLLLWYYYNVAALSNIEDKVYVLSFEDFVKNENGEHTKLAKFLKIKGNEVSIPYTSVGNSMIDNNLIHNHSTTQNLTETTKRIPIIKDLYDMLLRISENDNPFAYSNDHLFDDFINYKFSSTISSTDNLAFTTSLFFENNTRKLKPGCIQVKHDKGDQQLLFLFNGNPLANEFNVYFLDQPCLLKIKSVTIDTLNNSFENHTFDGNFIYNSGHYFIFNSNTPYLKFIIQHPEPIIKIEIKLSVEVNRDTLAGFIIPVNKYFLESISKKNSQLIDNIQSELSFLKERDTFILNQSIVHEDSKKMLQELKASQTNEKILKLKLRRYHKKLKNIEQNNKYLFQLTELQEEKIIDLIQLENKIEKLEIELSSKTIQIENITKELSIGSEKSDSLLFLSKQCDEKTSEQQAQIDYLKIENESLSKFIIDIKHSLSWRLTYPMRLFGLIVIWVSKPFIRLIKDIGYGIELLFRDGFRQFTYRTYWYLQGKRLIEDINHSNIKQSSPINFNNEIDPVVSIIIPVHNQWQYTYNCLKSIYENTSDVPYEIIIADDASTDKTKKIKKIIRGIKVIRSKKNLHFLKNCNNASQSAKGKYLHFLNNDVLVNPGWLSSLVKIMEHDHTVGIVGSKLVYPDGTLQEAGGIIWDNGTGWNYGRSDDAEKPEYNYLKEADYVSGASLLIRNYLWKKLNGFDELFSPAYYEDTDLAFRVRENGYKVIYQPLSKVIHFEGISNGKNVSSGIKKFQVANHKKFVEKWKHILSNEHSPNGENIFTAREWSASKKHILVIDHYVPHFDKDAGSRSTFIYISLLVKMGYNVKFIGDNFFRHEPYTTVLQQLGVEVLYGSENKNNIDQWFLRYGKYFDFVFCNRMHIAPKYLELIKQNTNAKIIYVGHDLNFVGSRRKYEITGDTKHLDDSIKYEKAETDIFKKADIILPFSTIETEIIRQIVPEKIVETVPVFFYNNFPAAIKSYDERTDLLYVGGFAHPPNIDAIIWFTNHIFPLVLEHNPEIKLYIVGSNPTDTIKELSSNSIIVTGYVDDVELENYYMKCRVAVIPLRMGAGVKGKLLESLYYQIPAVITPVAAEGVPEIDEYCAIAENESEFAEKIIMLYNEKITWSDISENCIKIILKYFTEESAKKKLEQILVK